MLLHALWLAEGSLQSSPGLLFVLHLRCVCGNQREDFRASTNFHAPARAGTTRDANSTWRDGESGVVASRGSHFLWPQARAREFRISCNGDSMGFNRFGPTSMCGTLASWQHIPYPRAHRALGRKWLDVSVVSLTTSALCALTVKFLHCNFELR